MVSVELVVYIGLFNKLRLVCMDFSEEWFGFWGQAREQLLVGCVWQIQQMNQTGIPVKAGVCEDRSAGMGVYCWIEVWFDVCSCKK